jgi:hypothetical protein
VSGRLRDLAFVVMYGVDEWLHGRGLTWAWLCLRVGRMEPGYYDRNTDWEHPLYVNPETNPELYLKHAADLCAHGYRKNCPVGCKVAA